MGRHQTFFPLDVNNSGRIKMNLINLVSLERTFLDANLSLWKQVALFLLRPLEPRKFQIGRYIYCHTFKGQTSLKFSNNWVPNGRLGLTKRLTIRELWHYLQIFLYFIQMEKYAITNLKNKIKKFVVPTRNYLSITQIRLKN